MASAKKVPNGSAPDIAKAFEGIIVAITKPINDNMNGIRVNMKAISVNMKAMEAQLDERIDTTNTNMQVQLDGFHKKIIADVRKVVKNTKRSTP